MVVTKPLANVLVQKYIRLSTEVIYLSDYRHRDLLTLLFMIEIKKLVISRAP